MKNCNTAALMFKIHIVCLKQMLAKFEYIFQFRAMIVFKSFGGQSTENS